MVLIEKFPKEVAEEVLEAGKSQSIFDHLKQDCYSKAVKYGKVDTDKAVEGLLEVIESSPAWSSYSGSYQAEHPVEYHTLAYYGDYTVKYILAQGRSILTHGWRRRRRQKHCTAWNG